MDTSSTSYLRQAVHVYAVFWQVEQGSSHGRHVLPNSKNPLVGQVQTFEARV